MNKKAIIGERSPYYCTINSALLRSGGGLQNVA